MKAILLLATLLTVAFAVEYVEILRREGVPADSGWSIKRRADPEERTTFLISLQQRNLDVLEKRFWANSDPTSESFAQHMTHEEINELTAPAPHTVKAVMKWIRLEAKTLPKGNLFEVEHQVDAIRVVSTNLFAEKLFKTKMHVFHNERDNALVTKHLGGLSIPKDLLSHITLVTGITELNPTKQSIWVQNQEKDILETQRRQVLDNTCNNPYTIKNLYNIPQNLYVTSASNASIYAEPSAGSPEGFGLGSVEDYQNALGIPKNPITCILGNGVANYITNDTDLEANLDTEMLTGIAPNAQTCFYIMESGNGWMYEFTREVFVTPNAPWIISMSYGWNEDDSCSNATNPYPFLGNCTEYHIPNAQVYVNLTNVNFQKLGLLGHTLLAASGDAGISGTHGSLDGCATQGPIFPAASPYVLTVGATSIEASSSTTGSEIEAPVVPPLCAPNNDYACVCTTSTNEQVAQANNTAAFDSGGGFSVYSPQPAYQTKAVQAYLKSGVVLPPAKYFNPNNRGFPDVAGVGENICLLNPGQECELVAGTSASTPLWGGIITLLNNDRLIAKKKPLGFVNQVVYNMFNTAASTYFYNGFDLANNAGGCPIDMGFNAKPGFWTPLTGCGSPNFGQIRKYVALLP